MSDHDDQRSDTENILLTLDQLSQTIDVMTSVVGRLRSHVQAQVEAEAGALDTGVTRGASGDRILH